MSIYGIFGLSFLAVMTLAGGIIGAMAAKGKHFDEDGIMR